MKEDFKEQVKQETELIKEELIRIGCKEIDTGAVVKEINGKNIYLVIYPSFLYNEQKLQVWYAVRLQLDNEENLKYYEHQEKIENYNILSELRKIFKTSKYKFFYDEDALMGIFSHGKPTIHNEMEYKAYCNPSIPDGAWSNHSLN